MLAAVGVGEGRGPVRLPPRLASTKRWSQLPSVSRSVQKVTWPLAGNDDRATQALEGGPAGGSATAANWVPEWGRHAGVEV